MAVFNLTNVGIFVDSLNLSGFANQLSLDAQGEALNFDNFAGGGWNTRKMGFATYSASVDGFQDYAATGVDPVFPITGLGGFNTFTFCPTGGAAVADPAFFGTGLLTDFTPLKGEAGQPANFHLGWTGSAQFVRGQMLHPSAARTATGNGTTTTFTAPTATQTLYAAFHVLAVSGAGSIVFKIQTDDNSGMTTPTDRITTAAITAVGGATGSLAGSLAGETHIRTTWTITGFTSVTFAVAAGVL